MAQKEQTVVKPVKKSGRITPQEIEEKIIGHLGSSGILRTSVLAQELGHDKGAVRRACQRLHEKQMVRLSETPKYLYRFLLTGDVVHRGNFPVVTKLISLGRTAGQQGGLRPNLKRVFASLRGGGAFVQNYINRCEAAARSIRSNEQLFARLSLQPFRILVAYWWLPIQEDEYEHPVRQLAKRLDQQSMRSVLQRLKRVAGETKARLERKAVVQENEAQKIVHRSVALYDSIAGHFEDSGAQEFLAERDAQLTAIASFQTTPAKDSKVVSDEALNDSLDVVHRAPAEGEDGSRRIVLSDRQLVGVIREAMETARKDDGQPRGEKKDEGWRWWLLQSLKLTSGALLVGVDAGLPLVYSSSGIIKSMAGTEIGLGISVASSMHTGAVTAWDALEKMLKPGK